MSLDTVYKLSVIMNMVDNLTGPMSRVGPTVDGTAGRIEQLGQTFTSITKTGVGMTALGGEITNAVLAPVEATFETRRALGELSSLGVQDLQVVEQAAKDFSNTFAGTSKADFISAAYDIKSGIASLTDEGVAKYTELAGLTAKATKSSTGEMTSLFATGYGIYKDFYSDLSDEAFGDLFSAGISKSVQAFKTTGSGMAEAISSLGASATTSSVPLEEQLSILGMLQATMSGSEAGTKYKAFLRSAVKGGEELGLNFTDANNQLLSMPEILGMLQGKFGETMDAAEKVKLQNAFGDTEAVALIDLLYNKTGDLQSNITTLYDSMGQGAEVTQSMADAINSTEADQYVVLQQNIQNLKETIGNSLLPTVNNLTDKITDIVTRFDAWATAHQGIVKAVMIVVLFIGLVLTILGTFVAVIGGVGIILIRTVGIARTVFGGIKLLGSGFETIRILAMYAGDAIVPVLMGLKGAALTAASGVWSFTAALLANPITWIVLAIVALIVALVLLWKNWDTVSAFLSNTWNVVCAGLSAGFNFVKESVGNVITWVAGLPERFRESGAKMITTLVEGIKSVASKPYEAITGIFSNVRQLLPFSDAKEGPLSELTLSGSRILETITTGMTRTEDMPKDELETSFNKINLKAARTQVKKLSINGFTKNASDVSASTAGFADRGFSIDKLIMNVDLRKIKDLNAVISLIKEIEDNANVTFVEPEVV